MNKKRNVEYSFLEIGEALNIKPSTARNIYKEAMQKIEECLKYRGISLEDLIE